MKTGDRHPVYYPVSLDLRSKKCVVVGGGQVALRKVKALAECKANVTVISPDLCAELVQMAERKEIKVLSRAYRAGDLSGAVIAVAATDDNETNRQIVTEARQERVPVNVVDDPEASDFIVPSYLRRGDVTIAVSTGGRSPALARKIRTRLEKDFGDEYASLAVLIDEVRAEARRQGIRVDGDAWQEALDLDRLMGLLKRGESDKARDVLLSNLSQRK